MPHRKDNYLVYASINGEEIGLFETWEGGDNDSADVTYTEGGTSNVSIGGLPSRSPIIIGRLFRSDRDLPIYPKLDSLAGVGIAEFTKQIIDDEGNPIGTSIIRKGILKRVSDPEADKNGNAPSIFELEMAPELRLPLGPPDPAEGGPPGPAHERHSGRR